MSKESKIVNILAIETSCDETAVAIVKASGGFEDPKFSVLSHHLYSQAAKHAEFGGVYPSLAKREHQKNLLPLLKKSLKEAREVEESAEQELSQDKKDKVNNLLQRTPEFAKNIIEFSLKNQIKDIDYIAVTEGPGLEPALWMGINFAQALSIIYEIPVFGVNHMAGHINSVLYDAHGDVALRFPVLALLISGGHTELVAVNDYTEYETIGETQDDAVGEAYDKTARLLGLLYPGGPEISKLSEVARERHPKHDIDFPRPMISSPDLNFSFSGLKTAVRYYVEENKPLSSEHKEDIAKEIEDAISEVLISKTKKALKEGGYKTLIAAGGVIASNRLRQDLLSIGDEFQDLEILFPERDLSTDNAVMIAIAGYFKILSGKISSLDKIEAQGNLKLNS